MATAELSNNLFNAFLELHMIVERNISPRSKYVVAKNPILFDCIVNAHPKSPQHDSNESRDLSVEVVEHDFATWRVHTRQCLCLP